ncbi:hypothetical protein KAJ27_06015 [bacterium]|nr:hypothetical protein [bacterium]
MMIFNCIRKRGITSNTYAIFLLIILFSLLVYYQFDIISGSVSGISCRHSRKKINESLDNLRSRKEKDLNFISELYKPVKLHILYEEKLLNYVPVCPQGGIYKLNENGKVYCTIHNIMEESKY